jgi:protein-S-isoprenylcysteine O-methyltransferase Ste14
VTLPWISIADLYWLLVPALWWAWAIYWFVAAAGNKVTRRHESRASRLSHVIPLLIGVALLAWPRLPWPPWLSLRLFADPPLAYAIGLALLVLGLAVTVWARRTLGRNWSATVTAKEGHELIRTGPYAYVRHPIYSGLLLALLGSAIARAEIRGFLGLAIVTIAWIRKLRIEETFMRELFPGQYQRYMAQVPALVPFTKAPQSAPH